MNELRISRYTLGVIVAVAFTGCGSQVTPTGITGAASATHGKSWMLPGTKSEDLLYVSNGPNALRVFSFPKGEPAGVLDIAHPAANCSDEHGNVYVVNRTEILEYAHGGTVPVNTLNTNPAGHVSACSVDPTTGNLAATVTSYAEQSYVAIFIGGSGSSENLTDSELREFGPCVYDNTGNLYVMGETEDGTGLTELPAKESGFISLSLDKSFDYDLQGPLQWSGKYLLVDEFGGLNGHFVYRVSVTGSEARIVGKTQLAGHMVFGQPALFKGTFIAGRGIRHHRSLAFWNYPDGGKPVNTIPPNDFSQNTPVFSMTVSLAPKY